jgi:competence protein ComFC
MSAWFEATKSWLNAGLGLVYPELCQLCGSRRATPADSYVCRDCRAEIRLIEPPFCRRCGQPFQGEISAAFECSNCKELELHFSYARSAAIAKDKLLEIIHRYKYHRAFWFEPFLAGLLIRAARAALSQDQWDWIVPVPLHPTKEREREFNQAARIAQRLAEAVCLPVNAGLLKRVVATRTQTMLSREERLENVRKAFALKGSPNLGQCRIVLVDDVLTTGATTGECARVLRHAGASEVCVWTVARGV